MLAVVWSYVLHEFEPIYFADCICRQGLPGLRVCAFCSTWFVLELEKGASLFGRYVIKLWLRDTGTVVILDRETRFRGCESVRKEVHRVLRSRLQRCAARFARKELG